MQQPSRFILEIPKNMLNPIRIKNPTYTNYEKHSNIERPKSDKTIKLGQKVIHKYFGEGTILNCDGQGDAKKVQIVFKNKGVKWLMFNQAPLTLI
jgi:DNA helicase-2/ATP-dependent DNA helicase PcrA